MDAPLTLRCRAAVARRVVAVVLLGYMSIAVPVYLVVEGNDQGIMALLCGGLLYLVILGAAIAHAMGLRCRMVLDEEGVTFVESADEVRFRWEEITAIEVGGDSHTWEVKIRTASGEHRPGALKCLRWWGQPKSLKRTVAILEEHRAAAL